MSRTRVYIAGPMSRGDRIANLSQALSAYRELIRCGYAPMCPQLTFFVADLIPQEYADWLAIDLPWVAASHAVLRLPGDSVGADRETEHASRLGIPVYRDLPTLLRHLSPTPRAA